MIYFRNIKLLDYTTAVSVRIQCYYREIPFNMTTDDSIGGHSSMAKTQKSIHSETIPQYVSSRFIGSLDIPHTKICHSCNPIKPEKIRNKDLCSKGPIEGGLRNNTKLLLHDMVNKQYNTIQYNTNTAAYLSSYKMVKFTITLTILSE